MIIPQLPLEYKFVKCMQYFHLDKNSNYTDTEINNLYEKLKVYLVIDTWEFPKESIL